MEKEEEMEESGGEEVCDRRVMGGDKKGVGRATGVQGCGRPCKEEMGKKEKEDRWGGEAES